MGNLITDLQSRKGKPCHICNEMHIPQNRCRFDALATKITKLMEANSLIPQILQHNKEATDLARHFQGLLKRADEAHTLLMGILEDPTYPDGLIIKAIYLEELDKWAASKLTSQDTSAPEQMPLFTQENLTPPETQTENSTSPTSGETSPSGSERSILSATSAEESPK